MRNNNIYNDNRNSFYIMPRIFTRYILTLLNESKHANY
jgi:hypothetical protein